MGMAYYNCKYFGLHFAMELDASLLSRNSNNNNVSASPGKYVPKVYDCVNVYIKYAKKGNLFGI